MSTTSYSRLPNTTRTVKYTYWDSGRWQYGEHVCYEKTDEGAIRTCYLIVAAKMPEFHITEIITRLDT